MKKVYLLLSLYCLLFLIPGANAQTSVFSFTGTQQTYTVPAGVSALTIDAYGGAGGYPYYQCGNGVTHSNGGRVQATLAVTPGQVLYIYVGGKGGDDLCSGAGGAMVFGGFNGGMNSTFYGGASGGATDIRFTPGTISGSVPYTVIPYTATNRVIVAGGGGGGADWYGTGGAGGGTVGGTGFLGTAGGTPGGGGTQSGPGTGGGSPGLLGIGGGVGSGYASTYGPGGGGYWGGNAGNGLSGGGGGGSSYTDPVLVTAVTHTQGDPGASGNGAVFITPLCPPGTVSGNAPFCAGSTITLTASNPGGTWSTSDGSTATVNLSGVVTGIAAGNAVITYTNICGSTVETTVTVIALPTVTFGATPEVCAGATSANLTFTSFSNAISQSATLGYTGGLQTWTVPAGVTSIRVDAQGANGGLNSNGITFDTAGMGGRVQATLAVTAGQVLNIYVGGKGGDGTSLTGGVAGYNGGGNGMNAFAAFGGGGGGGATDIRIGGITLGNRVLVAGGGGGAGLDCGSGADNGGNGGGLTGADGVGAGCDNGQGFGGTQLAGGAAGACGLCIGSAGTAGVSGIGGDAGAGSAGGGGGGGLYGGGGAQWNGAGGGSSYTDALLATAVTHTQGFNTTGDGQITITYSIPTTYSISWDGTATTAGFASAAGVPVSSSPIVLTVPGAAPAATYNASITITNGNTGCVSAVNPVSVTVKPIPDVVATGSQSVCNGASTTAITFTGSLLGTSFDWTNSDPLIGIGATGSGDIASFVAVNTSNVPVVATINVTPSLNGCTGTMQTITVTVNPTPDVNPSSNQMVCNGDMTTAVNFTGSVSGTTFSWTNSDPTIGLAGTGTGNIAAFTATNTTTAPVSATITVNTTANGCTGTSNSFTIVVNPTPILSSSLNPPPICDNTLFSYTPTSATTGTTFDWSRAVVAGISNAAATGAGDPMEVLHNTTAATISVAYTYTLTANGCTNVMVVNVGVKPTPTLSSALTPPAICDSTMFVYEPASATIGTIFTWSRAVLPGITNPAASGMDTIREVLWNSTPNPITVTYVEMLDAAGCLNTQMITVAVNPRPVLSTPHTIPAICDGSSFMYVPASATTGTTFTWSRATITGITEAGTSGADTISETLHNSTVNPIVVTYVDTLKANGCMNLQYITLTVNPTPMFTSTLTPTPVCNGQLFNYTPASATVGTVFSWHRDFVLGIGMPAASGLGNPAETMINNTNDNLNVVYTYTLTANGCSHVQNVTLVVHPTPTISSATGKKVCSGTSVTYYPTGYVFGTTFTWARAHVNGITPNTGSGSGPVLETLTDTALVPIATVYTFTLTANGCTNTQTVTVTVNPTPGVLPITTHSPPGVCTNTMYQNFGTSVVPPAGQDYHWYASNATVYAEAANRQYALINFDRPGFTRVELRANVTGFTTCVNSQFYDVNVTSSVSSVPQVVYFDGQLICLTTDEDNYQWGYDDNTTLDSTIIAGENNPNYFISGMDLVHRSYWVITHKDGCMQKTYYNKPVGITEVSSEAGITVYPNPAKELLNVEINTTTEGNYAVEVVNMLGQKMSSAVANDHKALIDVAGFAPGVYVVDCTRDGVKIGSVRFIKN